MLKFNDYQTIGISHSFEYLGEAFNYRRVTSISLNGLMISNLASDGGAVDPSPLYDIWDEMGNIRSDIQDFQDVTINGVLLGQGRVKSYDFPESQDPRKSNYSVELEVYTLGDMSEFVGEGYSNWNMDENMLPYLESIKESFDFQQLPDGSFNYNRSLSFTLIEPEATWNFYANSDFVARRTTFFGDPAFTLLNAAYPDFYEESGHRLYSESHDVINGEYNFSEVFKGPTPGEDYHWSRNVSITLGEQGDTSVSENGTITGVLEPGYSSAKVGMIAVEAGVKARLEGIFSDYSGACADELFLISSEKFLDKYSGVYTYGFDFSDDPLSVGGLIIEREVSIDLNESKSATIKETGSILARSGVLQDARAYYVSDVEPNVFARIYSLYSGYEGGCGCDGAAAAATDLALTSSNQTYSEFGANLSYDITYNNECSSIYNDCFKIMSETTEQDSIHNVFLAVTPYNGEIAQKQNTSGLAQIAQTISVTSICDQIVDIDKYISAAKQAINVPTENCWFMNAFGYAFDPDNSSLTMSLTYLFPKRRDFEDIDV